MTTFTDFEGNELRLGDKVLTVDLDKHGNKLRRGEIVKFCDTCVKVEIDVVCRNTGHTNRRQIQRIDGWMMLVERNPEREAELSGK